MQSNAGCHFSAGNVGWRIPELYTDHDITDKNCGVGFLDEFVKSDFAFFCLVLLDFDVFPPVWVSKVGIMWCVCVFFCRAPCWAWQMCSIAIFAGISISLSFLFFSPYILSLFVNVVFVLAAFSHTGEIRGHGDGPCSFFVSAHGPVVCRAPHRYALRRCVFLCR